MVLSDPISSGADDASQLQFRDLDINLNFLAAVQHQIFSRESLRDDGGNLQVDSLIAGNDAITRRSI